MSADLRSDAARSVHRIARHGALERDVGADVVGFKAFNLARMAELGLNVPPAFVIGTGFCAVPAEATVAVWHDHLAWLESATGLAFNDPRKPLLLSVRSGAPVSMPGMMETLLNIGLSDHTLAGIIRTSGNPRLAWDAYRRLVAAFGEVVAGVDAAAFEADLAAVAGDQADRDLDHLALRELARRHLATYRREAGAPFPQDPYEQLDRAIAAVFGSWSSARASSYRTMRGLPDTLGTAVTVQQMVFGNAGGLSGAGVGFTRDPTDGTPAPWVDFLFNAQGEDVVSGRRNAGSGEILGAVAPGVWNDLVAATRALEIAFRDMQDFEFTVQDGRLFLLQTRNGKRTPQAAARIALDMAEEGLIDRQTALRRTGDLTPEGLAVTRLGGGAEAATPIATAASASAGAVSGRIALDEAASLRLAQGGEAVILVRRDAETSDIAALDHAAGLLTQNGSRTSHAAVVARQLGKVCLVGCGALSIDEPARSIAIAGWSFPEGAELTIDGNDGRIYRGRLAIERVPPAGLWERLQALRNETDAG
ncbi:MAG: PEP/pyruvate-binding domain-containing protein [Phreatobacter sp.]|uniref:PEP/pyruvate-binding domain-containing protein n=1 Tax=Phreatobacter sp. TaxID=1966341 RepID=UPI002732AAD9|nr:PEP/pyruvate-binding domain-containing protein [Phreatobacter sp.]MDP2800351.1 PEP/pyruvate-binding domain-containing protein [Phreatobacter sp.]